MNKIFLSGVALTLFSGVAVAQNSLFPELEGQFQQPAVAEKPVVSGSAVEKADPETEVMDLDVAMEVEEEQKMNPPVAKPESQKKPAKAEDTNSQDNEEKENEKVEGNVVIEVQNVEGVLPYARTLAYCTGEAVLTNESDTILRQLSLTITYKDMPKELSYTYVGKKKSRTQKFMLIGLPCENILGMPKVEIKTCKLGKLSEEECKKRVQFIPPQG